MDETVIKDKQSKQKEGPPHAGSALRLFLLYFAV